MPQDYNDPLKKKPKEDKAPKVVEKVVTVEVIQKKKSIGRRFKEVFFSGDFKSAARYVAADVLLPALRNMMVDTSTKAIERVIYGDSAPRGARRSPEYRSYVQYNSPTLGRGVPYSHLPDQPRRYVSSRPSNDQNHLVIPNRQEAETVVERLIDIIDQYEVASIGDLNELVGLPTQHTDQKWGWTTLKNVEIRQVRDGYLIDLPPAEPI